MMPKCIAYKNIEKVSAFTAFLAVFFISILAGPAFSAQEAGGVSTGPTTISTESLSEKERAGLDKQYQFMVRGKDRLLVPITESLSVRPNDPSPFLVDSQVYRRYLEAAMDLYKAERIEESIRVFKYLNELDPDDEYVKSYLSRARKQMKSKNDRWKNDASVEAASMKSDKVKSLLREGVEFFKNKDFDSALTRFHDVLAISPNNSTAKEYMNKLKDYYPKKLEAEAIVDNWEKKGPEYFQNEASKAQSPAFYSLEKAADAMLDKSSPMPISTTDAMLDDAQLEKIAFDKKSQELLGEVEFGLEIDAIIAAKRAEDARSNQMLLGSGDILKISVLNHPELSGEIAVQSNGCINLPLTGDEIQASGLTIYELGDKITEVMNNYVDSPQISVFMVTARSQIFYVIDETSCTPYPITRPDFTLRDALFLADWGDSRALGRIIVMKPSLRKPIIRKVDAFDIIYRGNLKDNIKITNGDVIYIPLTVMAKTTKALNDTIAPFVAISRARDQYLDNKWNRQDYQNFFRLPKDYEDMSSSASSNG